MKKLVVLHYHDENYDVGGLVRFLIKMFNDEKYKKILLDRYSIEVITSRDIISKYNTNDIDFLKKESHTFSNGSIVFGIHPYGIHTIQATTKFIGLNIKKVGWTNDPHYFAYSIEEDGEKIKRYSKKIYPIEQLEILDYLVTPSLIYFKNLGIEEYNGKLIDMFYFIDPNTLNAISDKKYDERISKIILSGAIYGYTSRTIFNELRENNKKFNKLIFKLKHPGRKNNAHMTELNYYKRLADFKGAFVGHHDFPLDFLLAKHIEVLMCGCLGFFEPNPLLQTQLGLKEYEHYIPCYKDGKITNDIGFYTEWLNKGSDIAKQGQEYVLKNFGDRQIYKLFDVLSSM